MGKCDSCTGKLQFFSSQILAVRALFQSRDQHLCKFIGTKESVYMRKEFKSHRTGLGHKHGRLDVM